jgi:SAM-dependent methyltransferase
MTSCDPGQATGENGLVGDSKFQTTALENLAETPHYRDWLTSLAKPYLGDNPIELGSGTGDYAAHWLAGGVERITLTEIDRERRAILETRFAGDPRVAVTSIDIFAPQSADYSAMVSFNVLEHIENDFAALKSAHNLLRPGGYVFHLVPAFPFAMSRFDRELGHFRRYRKKQIADSARAAGLIVDDVRYLNAPGLVAWFVMMRLLKGEPSPGVMLRLWDSKVIPSERWLETKTRVPFGQSVVLLARTPA